MKPWEETWRVTKRGGVARGPDEDRHLVTVDIAERDAVLVAAAPEMARALLANGYERDGIGWHTSMCWEITNGKDCDEACEQSRTALQKAGVLP